MVFCIISSPVSYSEATRETGLPLKNNIFPGVAGIHWGYGYNEIHSFIGTFNNNLNRFV